jgi:transposase-like protein
VNCPYCQHPVVKVLGLRTRLDCNSCGAGLTMEGQAALDAARDEIDRLRRTIEENAHEMARVRRSAADSVEVVRGAHAESARLRGSVAGWLYVVEDALERDAAGQARALTLMRDQMRMALAGQQRLIAEARALRGSAEPTPGQTEGGR